MSILREPVILVTFAAVALVIAMSGLISAPGIEPAFGLDQFSTAVIVFVTAILMLALCGYMLTQLVRVLFFD